MSILSAAHPQYVVVTMAKNRSAAQAPSPVCTFRTNKDWESRVTRFVMSDLVSQECPSEPSFRVMKKVFTQTIVAVFALVLLSTCGERETLLSIAAGPSGGSGHPIGGVIGNVINKYVPAIRANVESTEGGVQNVRLLGTHQADIGLSIAATALNGYRGDPPYQQSLTNIRTLIASFQLGYLQMVVLEDSPLQSVEDIERKRVVLGPPGHGAIPRQREVYQGMGISFEDFTLIYLPFRDSLQSLGDRRVDASVL